MAKNKIRMPSSEGGIVRYFEDEYKSLIMLDPWHVVVFVAVIAIVAVLLRVL